MPITPPPGFEDVEIRKRAAAHICSKIDAVKTCPTRTRRHTRYKVAQDVIDDEIVLSSLVFVKDIEPYQPDLISQRVEGAVGEVAGGYNGQDPFFVAKGGPDDELREAREHDTQLALVEDGFPLKVWELGDDTAVWGRGAVRTYYKTEYYGEKYLGDKVDKTDILFSGPTDEIIKPEDFFPYPTWVTDLHQCLMVAHRFRQARFEILDLQAKGTYFDDEEIGSSHGETDHAAQDSDDEAPEMYYGIIGLRVGSLLKDDDDFLPAEDLEDAKKRPMKAYRFVVTYDPQALLFLEEYDLPECEYFSPSMTKTTGEFYPMHSVATKGLSAQTLYNDAVTGDVLSVVAAAKVPVLASGFVSDMDTLDIGLGTLIGFRGNPQFFSPPIRANAGQAMGAIADRMERVADGAINPQSGIGALPDPDQTATASGIAATGASKRSENRAELFNTELERNVRFKNYLIYRNFPEFQRFHGDKLWTRSQEDWRRRYEFGANGQGPSNNPEATRQKTELFVDSAIKMGTKFVEDLDPNQPQVALSRGKVLKGLHANLDFPVDFRDAIVELAPPPVETGEIGELPPGPGGFEGGPPSPFPTELLGQPGGLPPGLLDQLLGETPVGPPEGAELGLMPVGG